MKTRIAVFLIFLVLTNLSSADRYPPKTDLNLGQISLNCAVAVGITVSFVSDPKAQRSYGLSSKFIDSNKYAVECREVDLTSIRTTIRRIGGFAHDDSVSLVLSIKDKRIIKIQYGRGNERVLDVASRWTFSN